MASLLSFTNLDLDFGIFVTAPSTSGFRVMSSTEAIDFGIFVTTPSVTNVMSLSLSWMVFLDLMGFLISSVTFVTASVKLDDRLLDFNWM